MKLFDEATWQEALYNFFHTTPEQIYDEWRELKSFFVGVFVASFIWILIGVFIFAMR